MKLLDDTTPEARRVMIEAFRGIPPARTWKLLDDGYRFGRSLHAAGYRQRHPGAAPLDIHLDWIRQTCGEEYVRLFPKEEVVIELSPEQSRVLHDAVVAFRRLGIAYAIGGSAASSMYGVRRGSEDADIAADTFFGRASEFAAQFGPDYYTSVPMIEGALQHRSSFNLIHWPTGFKIAVFIRKDRPFDLSVLSRRVPTELHGFPGEPIDVVSAEDVLLLKLEWFRLGGEISDKQWGDILGVLRVQADRLDAAYLDHWAAELGVADLLAQAREQV